MTTYALLLDGRVAYRGLSSREADALVATARAFCDQHGAPIRIDVREEVAR